MAFGAEPGDRVEGLAEANERSIPPLEADPSAAPTTRGMAGLAADGSFPSDPPAVFLFSEVLRKIERKRFPSLRGSNLK